MPHRKVFFQKWISKENFQMCRMFKSNCAGRLCPYKDCLILCRVRNCQHYYYYYQCTRHIPDNPLCPISVSSRHHYASTVYAPTRHLSQRQTAASDCTRTAGVNEIRFSIIIPRRDAPQRRVDLEQRQQCNEVLKEIRRQVKIIWTQASHQLIN